MVGESMPYHGCCQVITEYFVQSILHKRIDMARTKNNPLLQELRGAIGKQFVIKQYAYGTVVTAYPDMSRVKPSKLQKLKQSVFARAVAYAQSIIRDPVGKKAYAKKLKKGEQVYTAAIREYLKKHKA
jgi:hypothetical protein